MKTIKIKQGLFALLASFALAACTSEVVEPQQEGNPTLQVESQFANVHFGDLLPFEVSVSDEVPLSTLQPDGTGAIWIIGDQVGKPSYTTNHVGWEPPKALCMAPIGDKKYRITLVAGESINDEEINFKFFHQKDWGGEYGSQSLTTESDVVFVGNGTNGRDNGNLGLVENTSLEVGATYVFTVDLSAGNDNAVLTVVKE